MKAKREGGGGGGSGIIGVSSKQRARAFPIISQDFSIFPNHGKEGSISVGPLIMGFCGDGAFNYGAPCILGECLQTLLLPASHR